VIYPNETKYLCLFVRISKLYYFNILYNEYSRAKQTHKHAHSLVIENPSIFPFRTEKRRNDDRQKERVRKDVRKYIPVFCSVYTSPTPSLRVCHQQGSGWFSVSFYLLRVGFTHLNCHCLLLLILSLRILALGADEMGLISRTHWGAGEGCWVGHCNTNTGLGFAVCLTVAIPTARPEFK
jgi:hypothetical protein